MLVYGKNVCIDYLKKVSKVKKIYLQEGFHDQYLISLIEKINIKPKYLPKFEIDKLAPGLNQGIILDVVDYSYTDYHDFMKDENAIILMLDHIEDPQNLGAIIRTVEAANISGVIIPKDRSASVNSTVIKTSVGTADSVKIDQVVNLANTIKDLKNNGFWIIGTDMTNATDYKDIDYSGKICIIIGNEGKGMSDLVKKSCDFIAKIPMYGKVNSLNASVSAAIMIFEALRHKG